MANTYSQISMHIVFAVKYRESLLLPEFRVRVFKYISGIIEGKGQKSLAVNGVEDHIHIFAGLEPTMYIPDFVQD
jgi:REP element-mobilizing transposase RayT